VRSRPELESILTSTDGSGTILITQFSTPPFEPPTNDAVVEIRKHIDATKPPGLAVHVTGNAGVAADQSNSIQESIERTTIITLALVVLILLWVYRSPVTVLVPLMTIGIAFTVSQGVVALLAQQGMKVSSLVENFMVVIIFGAGTDYCLFIISRFREEVGRTHEYRRTLVMTIAVVGGVIASSGATVIVGFVSQGVAKFGMFRTVGPAMAAAVVVTLGAGLTLTPALMRAFGRNLFWPAHPERLAAEGSLPELQVSEALGTAVLLPPSRVEAVTEPPVENEEPEPQPVQASPPKIRSKPKGKPKQEPATRSRGRGAAVARAGKGRR
jgi:RND superfamily putative drug exporter